MTTTRKIFFIIFICLLFVTLESIIQLSLEYIRNNFLDGIWGRKSYWNHDASFSIIRFFTYTPFWLIGAFFLLPRIKIEKKLIKIIFYNLNAYLFISLIYSLFMGLYSMFFTPYFFELVFATILSPIIFYSIPFFKKRMDIITVE